MTTVHCFGSHLMPCSCALDAQGDAVVNRSGYMDMKKVKKLIASKAVVFATCAAAGAAVLSAASQAGIKFKTVVVDEATRKIT